MPQPQHVSELLRQRLIRAARAARQMTSAGPVQSVAELLGAYGLGQVELRVADLALADERQYTMQVADSFVPTRMVSVQRKDYTVAVPFDGDPTVVAALLSTCLHEPRLKVSDGELRATFIVDPATPPQQLRFAIDARIADAAKHIANGQDAIAKYRTDLMQVITTVLDGVNAAHKAGKRQRDALGLPVRTQAPRPAKGSGPAPVQRQSATATDPLDILFEKVLTEIGAIGHELETFTGLNMHLTREEHTRDAVIICLRRAIPECDFTAETLHGQGKNDIHVRYQGQVVCVIELKRWTTRQDFKDSIDQLLSYLTYRDTRGAIVLLIRRQDVSSVIAKTKQWLMEHDNCNDKQVPGGQWRSDFQFHATGDPNQPIKLVYLPFALTTSATGNSATRGLPGGVTTS